MWIDPTASGFDQLVAGVSFSAAFGAEHDGAGATPIRDAARVLASNPIGALRHGAAFDFTFRDVGTFHLKLFAKRDARHWEMNPDTDSGLHAGAWSLVGSVEMLRVGEHGRRSIAVVPQLVLDLDRLIGAPGQFEATVQYGNWRSGDQPYATRERVPQASLRWRF